MLLGGGGYISGVAWTSSVSERLNVISFGKVPPPSPSTSSSEVRKAFEDQVMIRLNAIPITGSISKPSKNFRHFMRAEKWSKVVESSQK